MQKSEDVIVLRSEYGNLPPELKAMQAMMDMVFGAIAAPQAAPKGSEAPQIASSHRPAAEPAEAAPRRMDIEEAISKARGWDYNVAWEAFQAFQAKMEAVYEDRLDEEIAQAMKKLDKLLAKAEEPEIDPKWDEDQYLDDPRRL